MVLLINIFKQFHCICILLSGRPTYEAQHKHCCLLAMIASAWMVVVKSR